MASPPSSSYRAWLTIRLNASDDPTEQQTLSTSLVHPAIIAAGNVWAEQGFLRKLVIQGEPK